MSLTLAIDARANGPRALFSSSAAQSRTATQQPAPPLLKELQPHALWSNDSIIYDNGGPNQQEGNEMTEWIQAEDFNLSVDATLLRVNSWDIEAPGGTAYQGEIDWILYADAGGMPGASFASGAATGGDVTRTFLQSGVLGLFDEYSLSFDVSPGVALRAGTTYWLGLHNGPLTMTVRSEFYWESTNYNGTFTGHEDVVPFDGDWGDNETEHAFNLVGEGGGGGLTFESAFSSKGPFDIDLPLTGGAVEDRAGGSNKKYSIHQVFNNSLASVASATTTCGSVASFGVDSENPNQAFVKLVGVNCDASEVSVTMNGVVDTHGNNLASASITFCLLVGDVDGNGVVDRDDYRLVKGNLGRQADTSNFRSDVNANAFINSSDLNLVKALRGTHCP